MYSNNAVIDCIYLAIVMKVVDFQLVELSRVAQPIVHLYSVVLPT